MENRICGPDQKQKQPMVVLSGPTAVGKTKLSIALAKALGGEIISADSMQVYRHMDIGSAKITKEEMQGIPHHMIDILEPWEEFSVAVFQDKCRQCLPGIYERGHIPIVTGGTGFYVQALLKEVDFTGKQEQALETAHLQTPDGAWEQASETEKVREQAETEKAWEQGQEYRLFLEKLAAEKGPDYLHNMLKEVDPASAAAIHANNKKRVIRALEYFHLTKEPISVHNERERRKPSAYNSCYFVLNDSRERLYERIDQRVDEMMEKGLVAEVEALRKAGCSREMVSMQGLGYKEILAFLEGLTTLSEAVEILKRNTRHFAKRQLTWFRREQDVIWINKNEFAYDEDKILQYMIRRTAQIWEGKEN